MTSDTDHADDTEHLGAEQSELAGALVIDVRRAPAFGQSQHMLPGASWKDPDAIAAWAPSLDAGRDIVVYCVHGHEVSRNAARHLCALGLRARFLRGGFAAWQEAGLALANKPDMAPPGV